MPNQPAISETSRGIMIMGPTCVGKTTLGILMSEVVGWRFVDADDYHPQENVDRLREGYALTCEERLKKWIPSLRAELERCLQSNAKVVVAFSGLKRKYRNELDLGLHRFFLRLNAEACRARANDRVGHFCSPRIVKSQFEDMELPEPDEGIVELDATLPVDELVTIILEICKLPVSRRRPNAKGNVSTDRRPRPT